MSGTKSAATPETPAAPAPVAPAVPAAREFDVKVMPEIREISEHRPVPINGRVYHVRPELDHYEISRIVEIMNAHVVAQGGTLDKQSIELAAVAAEMEAKAVEDPDADIESYEETIDAITGRMLEVQRRSRKAIRRALFRLLIDADEALDTLTTKALMVDQLREIVDHVVTIAITPDDTTTGDAEVEGVDPTKPGSRRASPGPRASAPT